MPAKNTTELLKQLRSLMRNVDVVKEPLEAYIIVSQDAHSSEYIADCDNRRAFISGFDGSAGTAVITQSQAVLYTDGRYYLQAAEQLDKNWTLMKQGLPETPSSAEWLAKTLKKGSLVGVDPALYSKDEWDAMETELSFSGTTLIPVAQNLVDLIWKERPPRPLNEVVHHPIEFSGKLTIDKLDDIRKEMTDSGSDLLVITELDEVAWLLNLRGSDIPYNPVFFVYVIVSPSMLHIFIDPRKVNNEIRSSITSELNNNVEFHSYECVVDKLKELACQAQGKVWMNKKCNYALASLVPKDRLLIKLTPISVMKAMKNPIEVQGMINAHIRDGAAVCHFLAWLEESLKSGAEVTEVSAATKLESFRAREKHFIGLSFPTISGSGPNGAIIHYNPDSAPVSRQLSLNDVYLVDSGGQYKDGTTDITRTVHHGNPTAYQKECYTLVLKGQIALALSVFPQKTTGKFLDSFARQNLWQQGLDYLHGTGHGVGSYLNVHEGPCSISFKHSVDDPGLRENMFLSNEPGYYEEGQFGIRLENIIRVVEAKTKYNFFNRGYLKFEDVTFVPIHQAMIETKMLTTIEIEYLNDFHMKCRKLVGEHMLATGSSTSDPGFKWLQRETEPINL
ncbi:xaa-Pro aminopeptidase 1 [Folsomia candida]|uniref:Xaa-Pro aminopeptidase 1 n=1 Tax=Folsomia candida TaxID=158441 RepID=A0A226ELD4_FOLCA|nr:xaa-Pro aminopeptidase 1 [Folsomia candida]XP_035706373.1 xaa-Pro aminopeptidase 1 [Folsomia candida]XP_035706374.1 xaa-Pro aminopeptidase 1 [Folsomia candida]XP_035706375.1 xaa-Pro aminopeptidase 1 [Folsomia candida]OXA57386.1 Xaa-Pro aminopeptidase 1 [Folsomia candida]